MTHARIWSWIIPTLALAALLLALAHRPAGAAAQAAGVLCDTQEQVEAYIELASSGSTHEEALDQVNTAAKKETACALIQVIFTSLSVVRDDIQVASDELAIIKLTVIAILTPVGMMPIEPTQQFVAVLRSLVRPTRSPI